MILYTMIIKDKNVKVCAATMPNSITIAKYIKNLNHDFNLIILMNLIL